MSSSLEGVPFVTEETKQKIAGVSLINTEQAATSKENGETYRFPDAQCVVFNLENCYQLPLAKDDFCECIVSTVAAKP